MMARDNGTLVLQSLMSAPERKKEEKKPAVTGMYHFKFRANCKSHNPIYITVGDAVKTEGEKSGDKRAREETPGAAAGAAGADGADVKKIKVDPEVSFCCFFLLLSAPSLLELVIFYRTSLCPHSCFILFYSFLCSLLLYVPRVLIVFIFLRYP